MTPPPPQQPQPRFQGQQSPHRSPRFQPPPRRIIYRGPPATSSPPSQPSPMTNGRQVTFQPEGQVCFTCGKSHRRSTCPSRHLVCFHCGKQGHIQRVCRQLAQQGNQQEVRQPIQQSRTGKTCKKTLDRRRKKCTSCAIKCTNPSL